MKLNKNSIIGIVVIILIIIIAVVIINPFKSDNKNSGKNSKDGSDIKAELEKMGKKYYEKTFYPLLNGNFEILDLYKDSGLSNTLTTLSDVVSIDEDLGKVLAEKKCDYEKTLVIIYPKEPFSKNDYTIDVKLSCEK